MSDFISYNDWVGANAGQAQDTTAKALQKASAGTETAVGDAYAAGKSGQQSDSTALGNYGDFLKMANTGNYNDLAGALGGGATGFDAMLVQGAGGDQLRQAQQQYNQQTQGVANAYAAGARNADTKGAAQQMQAFNASNFNAGQGHLTPEQAKQAQQDSLAAGKSARLARERANFEQSRKGAQQWNNAIGSIFNPLGAIQVAQGKDLSEQNQMGGTTINQGGLFGSGFGAGGAFGNAPGFPNKGGEGFAGLYTDDDAGFAAWLKANGYDANGENAGERNGDDSNPNSPGNSWGSVKF